MYKSHLSCSNWCLKCIQVVERLFSKEMETFMEQKGYLEEARYNNWRRACDERGLSSEERKQFNTDLLEYILDDLMPWHKHKDFSHLKVSRWLHQSVLTMPILFWWINFLFPGPFMAYVASHKRPCMLWWLTLKGESGSSTTDDVECFFSILRDMIGSDFTLKQVQQAWRKACVEMTKRLDPAFPNFYHTSSHDRFYEGEWPNFDDPGKSTRNPRKCPHRIELLPGMASSHASLPAPGSRSVRMQFHNLPVALPPPPGTAPHVADHTYVSHWTLDCCAVYCYDCCFMYMAFALIIYVI